MEFHTWALTLEWGRLQKYQGLGRGRGGGGHCEMSRRYPPQPQVEWAAHLNEVYPKGKLRSMRKPARTQILH